MTNAYIVVIITHSGACHSHGHCYRCHTKWSCAHHFAVTKPKFSVHRSFLIVLS